MLTVVNEGFCLVIQCRLWRSKHVRKQIAEKKLSAGQSITSHEIGKYSKFTVSLFVLISVVHLILLYMCYQELRKLDKCV